MIPFNSNKKTSISYTLLVICAGLQSFFIFIFALKIFFVFFFDSSLFFPFFHFHDLADPCKLRNVSSKPGSLLICLLVGHAFT